MNSFGRDNKTYSTGTGLAREDLEVKFGERFWGRERNFGERLEKNVDGDFGEIFGERF